MLKSICEKLTFSGELPQTLQLCGDFCHLSAHRLAVALLFLFRSHRDISPEKIIIPLYTTCPAANSRQTLLATKEQDISLKSWLRPKAEIKVEMHIYAVLYSL